MGAVAGGATGFAGRTKSTDRQWLCTRQTVFPSARTRTRVPEETSCPYHPAPTSGIFAIRPQSASRRHNR